MKCRLVAEVTSRFTYPKQCCMTLTWFLCEYLFLIADIKVPMYSSLNSLGRYPLGLLTILPKCR